MTPIERKIYDILKGNPRLKLMVRNLYQGLFDLLPRQSEILPAGLRSFEGCFLGFHDIQPFSPDCRWLLAQQTSKPLTLPRNGERLQVGYIDLSSGDFHTLANTSAWNFHKGARLQWCGSYLIYNDRDGAHPYSVVRDIDGREIQRLDVPVDSVSLDGHFATTFSYERLERLMPGYGYIGVSDDMPDSDTGLFLVSMADGKVRLLLSIDQLRREAGDAYSDYDHFVTHTEFSPDGRYISFLHRYVPRTDISRRVTRLGIYDLHTASHIFLPPQTMVSHYVWNTRNQIIAYCGLDGIDSHTLFDIDNGRCTAWHHIAHERLNSDGHQTFLDRHTFVTDTYPDRRRMAKLFKVDTNDGQVSLLASLYSPKRYQTRNQRNHIACDFHPRASADGNWLCFDSPRTGIRSLCIMPLRHPKSVSVIIPTYKPQSYLWQCLDSVAAQTLDHSLFEVIIVLNGCIEPYRAEIRSFLDHNLREIDVRLLHTETPGVGNARNIGLDNARGEYIAFVDDDDYLSSTYLEQLLLHASHDTIALSNTIAFSDISSHLPFRIEQEFLRCHNAGRQPFFRPKKYISGPCMKLIPLSVIGNRRFNTRLRNGEDSLFSFSISDRMRFADFTSPDAIYYRRVRSSGAQFSVTRWQQLLNAFRLTSQYSRIYFSSPRRYSFRFYATRILGSLHAVIKGPKGI